MTVYLSNVNVWLALALSGHVHHGAARAWLNSVEAARSIQFCRATQQPLLRLLTNSAVLAPSGNQPLSSEAAWAVYEAFTSDGRIVFRHDEPDGLEPVWREFALRPAASPKLWMDAYLAAFARAGEARLVTTNGAFSQFTGVDVVLLGGEGAAR